MGYWDPSIPVLFCLPALSKQAHLPGLPTVSSPCTLCFLSLTIPSALEMMKIKGKYFRWSDQMDRVLNSSLLEQHNRGHHLPSGWRPEAYEAVVEAIRERCQVAITKAHVINRLKTWNLQYNIVKAMLGTDGFSWDWDVNMIKVESDEIWDEYVKDHPEAACYKTKIIENWADLPLICEKNRRPAHKKTDPEMETGNNILVEDATKELEDSHNTSDMSLPVDIDFSEQDPFIEQQQQQQEEEEEQQPLPRTNGAATNYLHSWPKSTKKRSRAGDTFVLRHQPLFSDVPQPISSAKKIFSELSIVKGLQEWQLLQIYDLLTEDERKFESFMALPNHLKKPWILMQIRK